MINMTVVSSVKTVIGLMLCFHISVGLIQSNGHQYWRFPRACTIRAKLQSRQPGVGDANIEGPPPSSRNSFSTAALPIVAVIGRPNTGKSSLVNRLSGQFKVTVVTGHVEALYWLSLCSHILHRMAL
jgi:hypothetical protein